MVPASDSLSPALERVLLRYGAMVRAVARRRGVADAEVEEVLQEVRIRLWKALNSGERIEQANTSYVYRTAMSAACDVVRRRRDQQTVSLEESLTVATVTRATTSPDRTLEQRELAGAIAQAVDALLPAQRPVVRMYLAGYAQAEIEALLGWSEAKTRNVLYRGLGELRRALSLQGITPGVA